MVSEVEYTDSFGQMIGGDRTGNNRWYEEFLPRADRLYDEHLTLLGMEGPPNG